jgi:hypothetical protein
MVDIFGQAAWTRRLAADAQALGIHLDESQLDVLWR